MLTQPAKRWFRGSQARFNQSPVTQRQIENSKLCQSAAARHSPWSVKHTKSNVRDKIFGAVLKRA